MSIEQVISEWEGQVGCVGFDHETGAFFSIAIHSRALGPAAGGTRAMRYAGFDEALRDATRLAGAMTLKMAIAGLPMGGGKSVIALPAPRNELSEATWRRILEVHAENLATLAGQYWTGPDVGTSAADMDVLHERSGGFAFGRTEAAGGPGSSAPETAHGVHVAIHAAIREAGFDDLEGRRVLVQGLGAVGYDLAARVAADGARVIATDLDAARCERARRELGAEIIEGDAVLATPCDVFAPCATGGVITAGVAAELPARVIAGAANNVLDAPSTADALARRRIVFAPDFVANGGGGIHLVGREVLGWSPDEVAAHVEGIGTTLSEVFELARHDGVSTERAARMLAQQRFEAPIAAPAAPSASTGRAAPALAE
ncbi:leucine dehydrogenase [Pseudoclavibacter endophyticus]|uniref:Glu/Leu/Phe/Val dehydrogenase n=1 Tax=Pseudoclavibacter endophyticus TaxID=1778590 RepID=A0A6H9WHU1_9MICO|nr:Glu/Leu/Phe/Val dehydrogenase dimerization domain-containing protein [Pseudoclavibacter endophyticus]KAB1648863.1 Glu/Leu/Phe/Val dehydrogenase [Pseudoclavibacter endophyticus]GGA67748.1 leucine dehydrogenase [Pseudoclavibacter endophyticus]